MLHYIGIGIRIKFPEVVFFDRYAPNLSFSVGMYLPPYHHTHNHKHKHNHRSQKGTTPTWIGCSPQSMKSPTTFGRRRSMSPALKTPPRWAAAPPSGPSSASFRKPQLPPPPPLPLLLPPPPPTSYSSRSATGQNQASTARHFRRTAPFCPMGLLRRPSIPRNTGLSSRASSISRVLLSPWLG